jgi:tungstate transport system substrate-binding protein
MKPSQYIIALLACAGVPGGCDRKPPVSIRLATTTSTENSGLLEVLLPAFRAKTGIEVEVLAMGTGKALRTGRDGNCDVVLVHSRREEETFVAEGWGVSRRQFMYNDFLIVGPASDPAGVKGAASGVEAIKKIAASRSPFVSRGDKSGTHMKEMDLWESAGLKPSGHWYRGVGKGMGETLVMADELNAYTLTDRGTFLNFRGKIALAPLAEGDPSLTNPYSIIAVNPARHSHVKHAEAMKLIEFLTSEEGQKLIGRFRIGPDTPFHPWPKQSPTRAASGAARRP